MTGRLRRPHGGALLLIPALCGACSSESSGAAPPLVGGGSGGTPVHGTGGFGESGGMGGTGALPGAGGGSATGGAASGSGGLQTGGAAATWDAGSPGDAATADVADGGGVIERTDPGVASWVEVPESDVRSLCGLDPAKLAEADSKLAVPWAVIRHGRLCHSLRAVGMAPEEAWSTTKTLGAVVTGIAAYETRALVATGPKTGPFSDEDRVDRWLDAFSYNPDAHVAHVLAMVAHNTDLTLGMKTMAYDTIGTTEINSLSDILNAVIRQDTTRFGADLEQFTQRFLFQPLGMTSSSWGGGSANKIFAFSWSTTVLDMARLGLLMLNGGTWNGTRVLDREWIYRMTHPAFEDANTGYGYLTWLNASSHHNFGGIPVPSGWMGDQEVPRSPGPCAPVSVYPVHPHALSDSPDCHYDPPYSCSQKYDVGVWQAVGLQGQVIQGHPGLDLVLVVKDLTPLDTGPTAPGMLWDAVRPAIVAADPTFPGDDTAFCDAYGKNEYAPDL